MQAESRPRKLLLHICCGPCAIMPVLRFKEQGYTVTGWFMNPNIHPLGEYLRRRDAAVQAAERLEIDLLVADQEWEIAKWLAQQLPRAASQERCLWCCQSRQEAAASKALELGFTAFSTSLLYSRYQPHEAIAEAGARLTRPGSLSFIYQDFRKDWQKGIDFSREWGLYRQPYCGCVFSEAERYAKKLRKQESACQSQPGD